MHHVFYINLKHRVDRMHHAETQFKAMGVTAERIDAIPCGNGAIGCALSHIKCIELAKERQMPYACICEDDILFLSPEQTKQSVSNLLNGPVQWEMLLLGANIAPPYFKVNSYCMTVRNAQTTTGYIIKQAYYDTLLQNIRTGISGMSLYQNPKVYAIDIYWKKLQKLDHWIILLPLSVVQRPDYSDIEGKHVNYMKPMLSDKSFLNMG
jgi:GR25 family glycosyltransferase involved in LPS biosynthesis